VSGAGLLEAELPPGAVWHHRLSRFTLLYVFNPFDLVPDFLPLLGEVDDAAIISACLLVIEGDLNKYRTWRQARQLTLEMRPNTSHTKTNEQKVLG
jgi:uncharacterized membrane protein YkvA (DUF1232 family)